MKKIIETREYSIIINEYRNNNSINIKVLRQIISRSIGCMYSKQFVQIAPCKFISVNVFLIKFVCRSTSLFSLLKTCKCGVVVHVLYGR